MSKLPFELLLALRYLRPKRTFVSIITLISILGVALGVAVLIIVISVMSGFDQDLRKQILGFNPQVIINQLDAATGSGRLMQNHSTPAKIISANANVTDVSPFVLGPVLVETEGDTNHPALQDAPTMRGIDPKSDGTLKNLSKNLVAGDFDLSGHGIIVGADFASNMHLQVGDHVSLFSYSEIKKIEEALKNKTDYAELPADYEIRGIYQTGYYEYDARWVIISIDNAQDLYGLDDSVHGLFATLKDPYQATAVAKELQKALGDDYNISTWMQNNPMLNAVAVEKNVMFYILFFIVLVAALCILSAQITFVIQKTREIGMLKALGTSKFQISGIFLFQSAIIGVIGVACGFGLGMLAVSYRNEFLHFLRHTTGLEIFQASVYGFGELPAIIMPRDVAIICVTSFIICILGGLLPAWRAGRLKPVEALRYE